MSVESMITTGVLAIVGIGIIMAVTQGVLSYLAQRNLNDIHSMGMQAIVGSNDMQVVDNSMEDYKNKKKQ